MTQEPKTVVQIIQVVKISNSSIGNKDPEFKDCFRLLNRFLKIILIKFVKALKWLALVWKFNRS